MARQVRNTYQEKEMPTVNAYGGCRDKFVDTIYLLSQHVYVYDDWTQKPYINMLFFPQRITLEN